MKNKKLIGTAALVACVFGSIVAKADLVTYDWFPSLVTQNTVGLTSGHLTFDGTTVTLFSFTEAADGTLTTFTGTAALLPDHDLVLTGLSPITTGTYSGLNLDWILNPGGVADHSQEQLGFDGVAVFGDWVPVPEPTTLLAGALLGLPFGASTLRVLRRKSATAA